MAAVATQSQNRERPGSFRDTRLRRSLQNLAFLERSCMRFDPVATAPGSDFVQPSSTLSLPIRVITQ